MYNCASEMEKVWRTAGLEKGRRIQGSVLDMLGLRCLLEIQVEMTIRQFDT